MTCSGLISKVEQDSIASEMDIEVGDRLLEINGQQVKDIIDVSFALADEYVELLIEKHNGEEELLEIEKEYNEELGVEFETAVFDGIRCCANHCIFCFVDQMPNGMRESLYVKDDDYRMSFLYGNFITLTNSLKHDFKRIYSLHLSPLYISVHATDSVVREKMMGNAKAGKILFQLKELAAHDIQFHSQVVLCPGKNDGEILDKTISDLLQLRPHALSLAIVPVGLTRYRDELNPLNVFSSQEAAKVIDQVDKWQTKCRAEFGSTFVYLADEFYLASGYDIPCADNYDGFPQLENGVGMVRDFLQEWEKVSVLPGKYNAPITLDIVCGVSAEKVLLPLLQKCQIPNLVMRVVPIENKFFGSSITVTGLLTAGDIINGLKSAGSNADGIIVPGVALRKGEQVFLDGKTPTDIANVLETPVRTAFGAADLKQLLYQWR